MIKVPKLCSGAFIIIRALYVLYKSRTAICFTVMVQSLLEYHTAVKLVKKLYLQHTSHTFGARGRISFEHGLSYSRLFQEYYLVLYYIC